MGRTFDSVTDSLWDKINKGVCYYTTRGSLQQSLMNIYRDNGRTSAQSISRRAMTSKVDPTGGKGRKESIIANNRL